MRLYSAVAWAGALLCMALFAGHASRAQQSEEDSSELWGGRGISLRISASGAEIEFDCGHGSIAQPLKPNASGAFSAAGTYTPEIGGPVQRNNPPRELPATYKGTISGDTMHLEVLLADKSRQPPPFTLTRGSAGKVVKCR